MSILGILLNNLHAAPRESQVRADAADLSESREALLAKLASTKRAWTSPRLAEALDLNKATVYSHLTEMTRRGWVAASMTTDKSGRKFKITPLGEELLAAVQALDDPPPCGTENAPLRVRVVQRSYDTFEGTIAVPAAVSARGEGAVRRWISKQWRSGKLEATRERTGRVTITFGDDHGDL